MLILYKLCLSFLGDFKAGILNKQGRIFIPKGYINDNVKLIIVSFNKCNYVFLYTTPKHDKLYKKNNKNINVNSKNNINLSFL